MKYIDTREAIQRAKEIGVDVSLPTMIGYCQPFPEGYDIGVKVGGRWKVNPHKLKLLLQGKQWLLREKAEQERQLQKATVEQDKITLDEEYQNQNQ